MTNETREEIRKICYQEMYKVIKETREYNDTIAYPDPDCGLELFMATILRKLKERLE